MDRTVKPGDDFDRYSSGAWRQATPIPPDRSAWGPFAMLRAKAESDVKAIVDDIIERPRPAGSIERKIADTYDAYLDTNAIEAAGLAPASADLALIAAARSHEDVARLMGHPELGVGGPLSLTPWPDAANPDRYAINIVQSGLSLPDRVYYLSSDTQHAGVRAKFRSYVAALLGAYRISIHEKPAPIPNGITGDQRVFLSWAQTSERTSETRLLGPSSHRIPMAPRCSE